MWSDNETLNDFIGYKVHTDLIRNVVTDPKLLPVTIGVFGDWGSGKTSIMKMLEYDLDPINHTGEEKEKLEKVVCLYFNGWLFEGYDDAKSAILTSILVQLGENKRYGPKVRDKIASLIKSVNWMRVAKLGLSHVALPAIGAYVTGGLSIIPQLAGSFAASLGFKNDNGEQSSGHNDKEKIDWEGLIKESPGPASPLDVKDFRKRFGDLLKETKISSLIVLIDDLDRCSPERIVENLEAIKLFLNVEHTAFVIGADPRIVKHAIAIQYKSHRIQMNETDDEEAERLITDYLEKLIQIPYYLPKLSPAEIETYMTLLFCARDLNEENLNTVVRACEFQRDKDRYSVFGSASVKSALNMASLPNTLSQSLNFCSFSAPLITEGLKGNPRQVKRFLNAFILRQKLARVANLQNVSEAILVKLMILEYGNQQAFKELFDWQSSQDGIPEQLNKLESGDYEQASKDLSPAWKTNFCKKWIHMEPKLSNIDLRDYFWIARDKLNSTMSGISMISPTIRRIFEDLIADNASKRHAGVQLFSALSETERPIIYELLSQYIKRNTSTMIGYNGYRALVDKKFPGAIESFARTLEEADPNLIPAAVGQDLRLLVKSNPTNGQIINPIIDKLKADPSTKIGRALERK